jgi:Family of unknown function (DUF6152)
VYPIYFRDAYFQIVNPDAVTELQPMRSYAHTLLLFIFTALCHCDLVLAHHSFAAEFDSEKPVTLTGTVVKWEMINPHGWITLNVSGPDGEPTKWMIETSNPNGLMRLGWTKNSLKPGDVVTIDAYMAKDGSNTANAASVTLPDGQKVFAGSPGIAR